MFTTYIKLPRNLAGTVFALLAAAICSTGRLAAQVIATSPFAVPHNEIYGAPWQNAVSNRGDFVLLDFKTSGLYQYPAGNGKEITLAAQGAIAGGFTDSGLAIDPRNNNIYINNNYNGGLIEFPYDAVTGTWDLPSVVVAGGLAGNLGGSCGNYYQSAALAFNNVGILAVATENGCGVEIFTVPVDLQGNFGAATPIVSKLTKRAKTLAIDDVGNIYFNEDGGGLPGALFLPTGTTGLTSDATAVRIDPVLGNVQGVSVDRAGNVYVADGTAGVYLIPLTAGVPVTANAALVTTAPTQSNPSLDQTNGILFLPINSWNGFNDLVKLYVNRAELGAAPAAGTSATATTIYYTFTSVTTPSRFSLIEAGAAADFAITTSGTCATGTAYPAGSSCTLSVNLTPHTVGDVSASIVMLDAKGNVLNSALLHGVGQGASVAIVPPTESTIGFAFITPRQIAVDATGSVYIADRGLGKVLEYAQGSTTAVSLGTGLIAPTGVAVDGTGNVFIADSGKVIEIPYSTNGLVAANQVTLQSGFGAGTQLAVDGIGNVFVADPVNSRIADLKPLSVGLAEIDLTGFSQLAAVATDGIGNLYIANGPNLLKITPLGIQSTVLTNLANTTGLAVDASGAVYVTSSTQTVRIPNEAGTLNAADQIVLAAGVAKPTSVAVDNLGNVYVADGNALDIDFINANGNLNLGTLTGTVSTSTGSVTVINNGNLPLTISGFSKTPDYSVTSSTCVGTPLAVGLTCTANVTFNPGAGDQGKLTGLLLVQGNQANTPIGINVIGIGANLAASTTTVTVTKPTVTSAPVVVKVASASGTGMVPTGSVTVTVTGAGITPVVITQPLVNGTVTVNETALPAGNLTFTVKYSGDRVYGTSNASTTAVVGVGAVTLVQPPATSVPAYVLVDGNGAQPPFDGSQLAFFYNYPVVVQTANGAPLLGVPIVNAGGVQTGVDYGNVTYKLADGQPACLGTAIYPVQSDGKAPFPTHCFGIDTSNNQIPNLTTAYTVTPVYTGNTDPNYGTVTGVPVTFIALRNPSVLLSAATPALTVTSGSTASTSITITSLLGYGVTGANGIYNNYSLPLELGCDALPAHSTCTFTYATPDPSNSNSTPVTPTAPAKATLTLNTNVPVGTSTSSLQRPQGYFAALVGLGLFGVALRRRKGLRASLLLLVMAFALSSAVLGLSACSSANIALAPSLTTPKGTYTVTVTAKQTGSKLIPNPVLGGAPILIYGSSGQISIPYSMTVTVQ